MYRWQKILAWSYAKKFYISIRVFDHWKLCICIKRHLADSWNILVKASNKTWTLSSAESEASTLIDSFWSFRYHESEEKMISLISRSCCWTCSFPILTCTNAPGDRWPQLIFLRDWLWCVYNTPQLIFIICNIWPANSPSALLPEIFFLNWSTLFKNYSKCRNWIFEFWHFPQIFVLLILTCLVTLFDRKLQVFKNSPKWTIFGIFD